MNKEFSVQIWPENVNSLPPDPSLLKQFKRQGSFNVKTPLPLMRAMVHIATYLMTPKLYKGRFSSSYVSIDAQNRKTGIRIIRPDNNTVLPVVLYLHGGGGLLTDSSSYIRVMKNIAYTANAVVLAPDYRRAPESPFPAALDDAALALKWVYENADKLQIDKTRISIAGDSAGGNLAAGLALLNRDGEGIPIHRQILINARVSHQQHFPSIENYAEGYGLTRTAMEFFAARYFKKAADAENIYASPLDAPDLTGLPPALIITSEYDPLRDEGEAFAASLHTAGVPVQVIRFAGMAHTMVVFGTTKAAAAHCMKCIAAAIQ